jgi:acyl dehydratase
MGIDEIRAGAGREAGVSQWLTVTQEMIDRFADATGDHQWIHVDVERARRESPFGATIAHGFLTTSLLSKMIHEAVEMEIPSRLRVNYGFNRLRFAAPVPAGSRIRAHITPNAVKDVEGGCEIAWGVTVEIENQAKPALAAEWLIRIYYA